MSYEGFVQSIFNDYDIIDYSVKDGIAVVFMSDGSVHELDITTDEHHRIS